MLLIINHISHDKPRKISVIGNIDMTMKDRNVGFIAMTLMVTTFHVMNQIAAFNGGEQSDGTELHQMGKEFA